MQCLCGLNQKPENLTKLRDHLKECEKKRLASVKKGYFIVWREGGFYVTDKPKKNEKIFGNELEKGKSPGMTTKVGLPTYTPTESLLAPQKKRVNAVGEKEDSKKKKK